MELLNLLTALYENFIRLNKCHPTQLLLSHDDYSEARNYVSSILIDFNPSAGIVTYRGIKIIRSDDIETGNPIFVTTHFEI